MSSEVVERVPVLIAGGGPAGLAAACELAHHGVRSVLVEPRAVVNHARPRAKTTSARTMEHFRRWGVAQEVRRRAPLSVDWNRRVVFCTTLSGETITDFHDVFGLSAAAAGVTCEAGQQVTQPVVEEVLRDHLGGAGLAELRLAERLVAVHEHEDGVTCDVARADGSTYRLTADYLVGADGSRSIVREAIGGELHGRSAPRANLNAVIRSRALRPVMGEALHYWVVGPQVPGAFGPLDHDGTWWVTLAGVGDEYDEARAVRLIAELAGVEPSALDLEIRSTDPWTPRMLLSDRFATERVFLVGESAHVNPPYGGHGFNTCVGDAVNLGWKLAAVLAGWGGPDLLATYEPERRRVAERTIASAERNLLASGPGYATTAAGIQQTKLEEFHSLGLVLGYSYADCGSGAVAPDGTSDEGQDDVSTYRPSTRPGARLPHAWVAPGRALYDELGRGLTLLVGPRADADAVAAARTEAEAADIPLAVLPLPVGTDWGDPSLLVRPDQHIAWRGTDLSALDLSRLCGLGSRRRSSDRSRPTHS